MKLIINDSEKDTRSGKILTREIKNVLVVSDDDILNFNINFNSMMFLKGYDIDLVLIPQRFTNFFESDVCELRKYLEVQSKQFIYF